MLLRSVARLLPFVLLLGACAQDEALDWRNKNGQIV